jgi:hypothetical protein
MRARSLVLALALAACVTNPDPRQPSLSTMQHSGLGGWIVITMRGGGVFAGELIAVEQVTIRMLDGTSQLRSVPIRDIDKAELYTYVSEGGLGGWAAVGTLTTISHGFFLVLTAPLWILSGSIAGISESRHVVVRYPDDGLPALARWARFPQGLPAGVGEAGVLAPRAVLPSPEDVVARRAQAWQLTQQAAGLARDGDCVRTRELAAAVRTLDAEFHDAVLARDVAIAACLAAPP